MLAPFIRSVSYTGLSCLLAFSFKVQAEVSVEIHSDRPGTTINKNIYGQFAEHLGRGIYEGIWVGPESSIPNTRGFRKDVIAALKELHVPLVRWPGGCFADEYHWRNGIGPRKERPVTVNTSWGGVTDDNAFGTHEFFELAEMLGAEVYINGNLGTGTPQEMAEWLEYMTSPSQSTLANLRRKNGREQPWKVHYFAIGNESWGCGGNMTPQYYADLYKHYATFLKTPEDNRPALIASGGYEALVEWTETLMKNVPQNWSLRMNAISHHYYTLPRGNWQKKGSATGFPEQEWLSTFVNTLKIEDFIKSNTAIMDKHDPEKKVGFYVDEWGTWYDTEEGDNPGFLFQQNTLRDALVAAVNFNIFHKYSERVQMTNIAQMVNVLQAMILTDKEKMVLTPTYYAFKMYVPFQQAVYLPTDISGNPTYSLGDASVPQTSVSAAKTGDGNTVLALTNVHPTKSVEISVKGKWKQVDGQLLTGDKMDSLNRIGSKEEVKPKPFKGKSTANKFVVTLPAKSVAVFQLKQ
jgi:alpha-N-arabinofuranosidase